MKSTGDLREAVLSELRDKEREPLVLLKKLNRQGYVIAAAQEAIAALISTGEIQLTSKRILNACL